MAVLLIENGISFQVLKTEFLAGERFGQVYLEARRFAQSQHSEEEIDMGVLMRGPNGEIIIGGRGWSLNHPPESISKRKHSEIKNRTAKIFSEEYPNETFRVDLN